MRAPHVTSVPPLSADRSGPRLVADAVSLASRLPDLLTAAHRLATGAGHGLHGRRRAGRGEEFWQYRRYGAGENAATIDWRRSGRDDHLYVREREWQSAHTIWIWVDLSPSMSIKSDLAGHSKRDRAVLLALALAQLAVERGERVGLPGLTQPMAGRFAPDRLAQSLLTAELRSPEGLPPAQPVARFAELVLVSDLLCPAADLQARLDIIASKGAHLHLVQVLDPVEEVFPFDGRLEFVDPETKARFLAGRAEQYRADYARVLAAHRASLRQLRTPAPCSLTIHHTDRDASEALLSLAAWFGRGAGSMEVPQMAETGR